MNSPCLQQTSSTLFPRHYYQVALDFRRLSKRISESRVEPSVHPRVAVKKPATVLHDWEVSFQQYVRPLARIFNSLSTQVLAKSQPIKLIDTVVALVPLEQQVFRLLSLRNMVIKHQFQSVWQRGQVLFLARIDKILADLQNILSYFNEAIKENGHGSSTLKSSVWDKEIECTAQTRAFNDWCLGMGCVTSQGYLAEQRLNVFFMRLVSMATLLWNGIRMKKATELCNS